MCSVVSAARQHLNAETSLALVLLLYNLPWLDIDLISSYDRMSTLSVSATEFRYSDYTPNISYFVKCRYQQHTCRLLIS